VPPAHGRVLPVAGPARGRLLPRLRRHGLGRGGRGRLLPAPAPAAASAAGRPALRRRLVAVRGRLGAEVAVRQVDDRRRALGLLAPGPGRGLLRDGLRRGRGRRRRLLLPAAAAAGAAAGALPRHGGLGRLAGLRLLPGLGGGPLRLLRGRRPAPPRRRLLRRLRRLLGRALPGPCRLLGLRRGRERALGLLPVDELGERDALEHRADARLDLLPDEAGGARDDDVEALHLADAGVRVVEADLAELELELLAGLDRRLRREAGDVAAVEQAEVVEVDVLEPDEEEGPLRDLLELAQPRAARAGDDRRDPGVELHLERLRARARRHERAQLALDLHRRRPLRDDDPVAAAGRALAGHHLARAVGDVLARHLDEPERRDLDDVRLRAVALELLAERVLDLRPVLRVRHVDEVDHDDPAHVAQPELAHDLLHRLEVVLRDRVLQPPGAVPLRPRADEPPGVHVDHRERLRVVEDQVAAGGQVDAPVERRADLLLDAEALEQRLALLVADDPVDHVRRGLLQVADDALVGAVVVDEQALEALGEEVARHAQRQLGLLVDEARRRRGLRARLDRLPEPLEELEVALDVLRGGTRGRGADDHAAALRGDLLDDRLEAVPLLVLEPAGHAEPLAVRDEDDEAAGQRDLRGQPGALRLH